MCEYFNSELISALSHQRDFAEHMHSSLFALSRSGGLGKLEMLLLYAFRDRFDKVEVGL